MIKNFLVAEKRPIKLEEIDKNQYYDVIIPNETRADDEVQICVLNIVPDNIKLCFVVRVNNIHETSFIIDGDLLIGGVEQNFIVYDLKRKQVIINNDVDTWIDDVFRLEEGYFYHGELYNGFFDKDFNLIWQDSGPDIFENSNIDKNYETFNNQIAIYDWYGTKYIYNKNGLIKTIRNAIKPM